MDCLHRLVSGVDAGGEMDRDGVNQLPVMVDDQVQGVFEMR
jgi:hypothetical protein